MAAISAVRFTMSNWLRIRSGVTVRRTKWATAAARLWGYSVKTQEYVREMTPARVPVGPARIPCVRGCVRGCVGARLPAHDAVSVVT